jgi:hypothetical protein
MAVPNAFATCLLVVGSVQSDVRAYGYDEGGFRAAADGGNGSRLRQISI